MFQNYRIRKSLHIKIKQKSGDCQIFFSESVGISHDYFVNNLFISINYE